MGHRPRSQCQRCAGQALPIDIPTNLLWAPSCITMLTFLLSVGLPIRYLLSVKIADATNVVMYTRLKLFCACVCESTPIKLHGLRMISHYLHKSHRKLCSLAIVVLKCIERFHNKALMIFNTVLFSLMDSRTDNVQCLIMIRTTGSYCRPLGHLLQKLFNTVIMD